MPVKNKIIWVHIALLFLIFFLPRLVLTVGAAVAREFPGSDNEQPIAFPCIKTGYPPYRIISQDLDGSGIEEIILVYKKEGTGSPLSYQIWKEVEGQWVLWWQRENLYGGVLIVENNSLIEKTPVYEGTEANALPGKFLEREYSFTEDGPALIREEKKPVIRKFSGGGWVNPPREEIKRMIERAALGKGVPPVIVKAIAYTESNMRQFHNGEPLQSFDGVSWGIMQVTPHVHVQYDEEKLKYDIEYNIRAGVEILLEKWGWGVSDIIPRVGNNDPRILEHWYFAIWSYNGWSQINNPNMNQSMVYQEKVFYFAQTQFNQVITPIPPEQIPGTGTPPPSLVFPTPEPFHEAQFLVYAPGDILIDTSQSGLTLRDDSWGYISNLLPGTLMSVLEGPVLYNGYIRYKIKTLPVEKEGWIAMNWAKRFIMGDVSSDNTVDLGDAIWLLRYLAGVTGLSENQLRAANVSGSFNTNGFPVVNAEDLVLLLQYVTGLIEEFPNIDPFTRMVSQSNTYGDVGPDETVENHLKN